MKRKKETERWTRVTIILYYLCRAFNDKILASRLARTFSARWQSNSTFHVCKLKLWILEVDSRSQRARTFTPGIAREYAHTLTIYNEIWEICNEILEFEWWTFESFANFEYLIALHLLFIYLFGSERILPSTLKNVKNGHCSKSNRYSY